MQNGTPDGFNSGTFDPKVQGPTGNGAVNGKQDGASDTGKPAGSPIPGFTGGGVIAGKV